MSNGIISAKYVNAYLKDEVTIGHKNITIEYGDYTVSVVEGSDSRFYEQLQAWVADGNTIEPADE